MNMKRTTIKLPEEVDYALRAEAERRRVTISALTREAIETFLGLNQPRRFGFVALGRSGETDISERVEEILREEWTDPHR